MGTMHVCEQPKGKGVFLFGTLAMRKMLAGPGLAQRRCGTLLRLLFAYTLPIMRSD